MYRSSFVLRAAQTIALGGLLIAAGCSSIHTSNDKSEAKTGPQPGTQVRTGGDGFALGDVEQPGCTSQKLIERVAEQLRDRRTGDARRLVERYPDVALEVLREPGSLTADAAALRLVAETHDRHVGRAADLGWTAIVAARAEHADRFRNYDELRRQFMFDMQNGRTAEALRLPLVDAGQAAGGRLLAADALRLVGIAQVLDSHPAEAVRSFQAAAGQLGAAQPYQTINLLLLASDAQRRTGDHATADRTWKDAVRAAAELAAGSPPVCDPILWERVAYLRPAHCPWPTEACRAMVQANVAFGITPGPTNVQLVSTAANNNTDEAMLWAAIGHWRLARDEAQAALVALKRAESLTSQTYSAGRLQLSQARALVRLGQAPAGMAILIHLSSDKDPQLSHPAMAMLGAAKLQQGSAQQGFNLLRTAVDDDGKALWPERADAEADLGLAFLVMGDETQGLRWLHQAQQSFEQSKQFDALRQCLENEAAWLDQAKRGDQAKAIRHRLDALRDA